MLRALLSRFPLTLQVVLALMVLGGGSLGLIAAAAWWQTVGEVRQTAVRHVMSSLHASHVRVSRSWQAGVVTPSDALFAVPPPGAVADLEILIDDEGIILASSRRTWIGKSADALPGVLGLPRDILDTASALQIDEVETFTVGRLPVCRIEDGHLSRRSCLTLVYVHDTAPRWQAAVHARSQEMLVLTGTVISMSLVCWWLIGLSVTAPTTRIVEATGRFRRGDRTARCRLAGRDELAGIGRAIDDAFDEIAASEVRLRLLESAVTQTANGVVLTDIDGIVVFANAAVERMSGYRREDLVGRHVSRLRPGDLSDEASEALWSTIRRGESWNGTFRNRGRDGTVYWERVVISPVRGPDGDVTHFLAIKEDITEQVESRERQAYDETHDRMTGLANRVLAERALTEALASGGLVGIVHLDVASMGRLNEAKGYDAGNRLIGHVAEKLRRLAAATPADTDGRPLAARVGGDEFVLVVPGLTAPAEAETWAQRALAACAGDPVILEDGTTVTPTLRAGIVVAPRDGDDAATLLGEAYFAAARAKDSGGLPYRLFDRDLDRRIRHLYELETSLKKAVYRQEIEIHAQRFVAAATGDVVGAELLIRWRRPEGLVSPADFIPLAERCGAIVEITDWLMREAAATSQELNQALGRRIPLAVNVSPVEFSGTGLLERMETLLLLFPDASLEVEVTEGVFAGDKAMASDILGVLGAMGVPLAIDDFGTGYSSLSYLRDHPFTKLKIDRSFIIDAPTQPRHRNIVAATVALAHSLGLKVTAEGVETEEQAEVLRAMDVDYIQGYLFGKPQPIADFVAELRQDAEGIEGPRRQGG
ncbi:PAS domain S-box-containing protein/diguanylate cyclase (GGDEF) domain-containing protein [Caenispirillum bisanense]|uniref:PAS domain S-box-containing protein/diguanylate cyclase (GGDEF) domain-containing protein n=2 Tax=Caenispirillum bisanense TaxID=414052 RepID=A0A286H1V8_9PROT|nr:PAS domain S-box-containing protein/diguanylate cyclase (GGDEF) domain-containing protein [Caenispirillum bisanense]